MPQVYNRNPEKGFTDMDRIFRSMFGTPPGDPSGESPHPGWLEFLPILGVGMARMGQGIRSAAIAKLLQQAQAGDQQATSTLMEGLATRLKGIANRLSGRYPEAARGQTGDLINVGNERRGIMTP